MQISHQYYNSRNVLYVSYIISKLLLLALREWWWIYASQVRLFQSPVLNRPQQWKKSPSHTEALQYVPPTGVNHHSWINMWLQRRWTACAWKQHIKAKESLSAHWNFNYCVCVYILAGDRGGQNMASMHFYFFFAFFYLIMWQLDE